MQAYENDAIASPGQLGGSFIKQWSVAAVLMACVVLAFFDKISIAVLFSDPHFQAAMGIDAHNKTALGWLMTSFLLAYGFSSIMLSMVGDLVNPKTCLLVCTIAWGLLMVAMGFTTDYSQMLVLRVLLGIAEGPLFALAYAIVKQCYQPKQMARASTMFLLGTPLGAALGFPITAYVLGHSGWEMTFFVMAAITAIVVILILVGLKDVKINTVKKDTTVSHKENCKILFTSPAFWAICIFNTALLTYLWGLNGWLPSYLIETKGINLKQFGSLSSLPFIAMLVGEIIGAFVADKTGRRAPQVFIGLLLAGIAMGFVPYAHNAYSTIIAMAVSAFFWGLGSSAVFALLSQVSSAKVASTAGGIFNGFGNFAGAAAPVLMGYIVTQTNNFNNGMLFLVVVSIIGSMLLLPLLKKY